MVPPWRLSHSMLYILLVFGVSMADPDSALSIASHPRVLRLTSGHAVEGSPGLQLGSLTFCERVHIIGFSRFFHLGKYAHSLKVKVQYAGPVSKIFPQNAEICFHSNSSLGLGMCPQDQWEKLAKSSWSRYMSPFVQRCLDIRVHSNSLEFFEVSTHEEFSLFRIVSLIVGIVFLTLAPALSKSIVFYYGSAMVLGIILVILLVLFQGMKLLPSGRKSSLAIFLYSSAVGFATFVLQYLSGLLRSLLVRIGISEDIFNPVAILLLACLALAGAWLGFWGVRRLILNEDGSIDMSMAYFVKWSIWAFSSILVFQSTLDTQLGILALISALIFCSVLRRILRFRFIRYCYRSIRRKVKSKFRQDMHLKSDAFEHVPDKLDTDFSSLSPKQRVLGLDRSFALCDVTDADNYYSTFHRTPERKKYTQEEWDAFTRTCTRGALQELVASPDFTRWAVANAERITLTPPSDSDSRVIHRRSTGRWFSLF